MTGKQREQLTILSAVPDGCYTYHGSWADYYWNITAKKPDGTIVTKRISTPDNWDANTIVGKTVECNSWEVSLMQFKHDWIIIE